MSDLISRADAIEAIASASEEPNYQHEGEDWMDGLCQAEQIIDALPSADAVKVVCCEDCRHRNTWDNPKLTPQYYRCRKGVKFRDYGYVREDDYCPLGERREESEVE